MSDLTLITLRRGWEINLPHAVTCDLCKTIDFLQECSIKVPVTVTDKFATSHYDFSFKGDRITAGAECDMKVSNFTPVLYPVFSNGLETDCFSLNDRVDLKIDTSESAVISIEDSREISLEHSKSDGK